MYVLTTMSWLTGGERVGAIRCHGQSSLGHDKTVQYSTCAHECLEPTVEARSIEIE